MKNFTTMFLLTLVLVATSNAHAQTPLEMRLKENKLRKLKAEKYKQETKSRSLVSMGLSYTGIGAGIAAPLTRQRVKSALTRRKNQLRSRITEYSEYAATKARAGQNTQETIIRLTAGAYQPKIGRGIFSTDLLEYSTEQLRLSENLSKQISLRKDVLAADFERAGISGKYSKYLKASKWMRRGALALPIVGFGLGVYDYYEFCEVADDLPISNASVSSVKTKEPSQNVNPVPSDSTTHNAR